MKETELKLERTDGNFQDLELDTNFPQYIICKIYRKLKLT